jgi:formylglycine-generating enzyme required for sulfatase activity
MGSMGGAELNSRWDIKKLMDSQPLPDTIVAPIDGAEMVIVPAGEFTMGLDEEDIYQIYMLDDRENPVYATEPPARKLHLDAYYIDRYPVTNFQYRKFIDSTGHREPMLITKRFRLKNTGKRPVAAPMAAGGHGGRNFCRIDVIPENSDSCKHRK